MSEARITARTYWFTWLALVCLTGLSFATSYVVAGSLEVPVTIGIAGVKALLVTLFFMHLARSQFAYRFILLVGVLFVVIMVSLTILDLFARVSPQAIPPLTGPV
jgi:cytochrome c oxidase subunit 4